MEAVFGLAPDDAGGGVEDVLFDFEAGIGGEAVEEERAGVGGADEFAGDGVGAKGLQALHFFLFHTHAGPNVGVEGIGAFDGIGGIGLEGPGVGEPGLGNEVPGGLIRIIFLGAAEDDVDAENPGGEHPRVGHITIGVPEKDQPFSLEGLESGGSFFGPGFGEGKAIGVDLAGVIEIGEGVDDRDGAVVPEGVKQLMFKAADDNAVEVSGKDAGGIGGGFAASELGAVDIENDRMAAELPDADLEAEAGSGAALIKDERPGLAFEGGGGVAAALALKLVSEVEELG